MSRGLWRCFVASAGIALVASAVPRAEVHAQVNEFVTLTPFQTFYRTDASDSPQGAAIVDISGIADGATIHLAPSGTFSFCGSCEFVALAPFNAVFSSTSTLLGPATQNRVPDAVNPGIAPLIVTGPTLFSALATDIPFDFLLAIQGGIDIQKPTGANYLFLGLSDSYYADNRTSTPNSFGVTLSAAATVTPEPGSMALLATGLAGLGAAGRKRRNRSA